MRQIKQNEKQIKMQGCGSCLQCSTVTFLGGKLGLQVMVEALERQLQEIIILDGLKPENTWILPSAFCRYPTSPEPTVRYETDPCGAPLVSKCKNNSVSAPLFFPHLQCLKWVWEALYLQENFSTMFQ